MVETIESNDKVVRKVVVKLATGIRETHAVRNLVLITGLKDKSCMYRDKDH